jgi:CRP/FNR family transcriptional regulator
LSLSVADILADCRLFADVPPAGFQRLAAIAQICKFRKDRLIFRQGDACPGVYIVGDGLVRVFKIASGGKEHVLHMAEPGQTFAEVAAIGRFELPASAQAVVPTTCALLPIDPFHRAIREDHSLCLGMMTGLTLWVRHLVGLMEDIVLRDALGRIARYLLDSATAEDDRIELPTLKRHVASHLNLTSETFSRGLRRLGDAGLIRPLDQNRWQLVDRPALKQIAEGLGPRL